jgi:hypothetical protein
MSTQQWTLIAGDDSQTEILDQGGSGDLAFVRRRLRGGLREGVEVLDVTCGELVYTIVLSRGLGLWRAAYRDVPFGWRSPIAGPVHPAFVQLRDPCGLGFLDGFDEMLTRCGLSSSGAPEFDEAGRLRYPLHGRIANLPAQSVEVRIDAAAGSIEVHGVVREARFHFGAFELHTVYHARRGEPTIVIRDAVKNCGSQSASFQLLYHVNFGPPLLEEGAQIVAPVHEMAPRDVHAANGIETWNEFRAPRPGFTEECLYMELLADKHHLTEVLLRNASGDLGAYIKYDLRQLPCFTLWKDGGGTNDGYVTGLEPATNYPNIRTFEESRGRVAELAPGESYPIQIELGFCVDSESVASHVAEIEQLQTSPPKIVNWMDEKYSPEGISDLS